MGLLKSGSLMLLSSVLASGAFAGPTKVKPTITKPSVVVDVKPPVGSGVNAAKGIGQMMGTDLGAFKAGIAVQGTTDVAAGVQQTSVQKINDFSQRLMTGILAAEKAEDKGKNVFITGPAMTGAVAMLLNGASKVGQEELLKSLGFSAGELKDVNAAVSALMARMNAKGGSVETSMANALFADVGLPIKQDYAGLMESSFGATLKNVEFEKNPKAAAETVNKWAQDNTQGMVKEIVTEETAAELASLLATAVFFKGNWEQQFDPKSTYDDTFILANGDFAQVPTMHGTMDLKGIVDWEKGYNIAQLNYTGGDVSMYVMMPSGWDNKMTVEQLLAQVTSNGTLDKFSNGSQEVREFKGEVVNLPKFKIAYTNAELKDIFKAMGVNAVFDAGNLLGMSSDERLKVVYIRMDTALEVDEKGTKAAGVASIGSALESASSDPFDFNKPFAIVIRDNKTGINLFQGIIRDPRK